MGFVALNHLMFKQKERRRRRRIRSARHSGGTQAQARLRRRLLASASPTTVGITSATSTAMGPVEGYFQFQIPNLPVAMKAERGVPFMAELEHTVHRIC
ncbi:unnamed protein product [Urochloa humidicola]